MTVPVKVLLKWISQHANAFDAIKSWHILICHIADIEEFCPHYEIYYSKPTGSISCTKYLSFCCWSNITKNDYMNMNINITKMMSQNCVNADLWWDNDSECN